MPKKKINGRPPFYRTAYELQRKIDKYFDNPPRTVSINIGSREFPIEVKKPLYTISGLALYLGFCDRYSLYEYEANPKFTYTIKKARARITQEYEEQVTNGNSPAIFMLKNFGYSDKQEMEMSGEVNSGITIISSKHTVKV